MCLTAVDDAGQLFGRDAGAAKQAFEQLRV